MRMRPKILHPTTFIAAIALAAVLLPIRVLAQPEPEEPAEPPPAEEPAEPTAAELREQANAALDRGDVEEACSLLERSHQMSPDEDVQFELAQCLEQAGKKDEAAEVYDAVAQAGGARAPDAERRAKRLREPAEPEDKPGPTAAAGAEAGAEHAGADRPVEEPADDEEGEAEEDDDAPYSPFMDTRLTWTFGDDDILHQTGQAVPLSPNPSIGDRKQYRTFFDNLNSRFGGRENLTHLALYKKMPGFIDGLDTEASLVLRFDLSALSSNTNNLNRALYDSGSFIRIFYHLTDDEDDPMGIGLTFWPLDTDRYRLGYLYDISWGGTNGSINQSIFPGIQGTAPGAKLQFDHERFSIHAGFKTAQIVQVEETLAPGTSEVEVIRVGQTNYGVLGGFGVQIIDNLRLDAGGGYFQQGKFELPDVAGEPVFTAGASARIVVHHEDYPAPDSVDFLLYRNDPNKPLTIFSPASYDADKTTWNVGLEATHLWQNLKDFEQTGVTRLQPGRAMALQGNLKSGYLRMSLTGIYRDLSYVLRNVPSYVPFETLPEDAEKGDELFVAFAGDYHFESVKLTPGIGAGLQFPSTFKTNSVDLAGNTIGRTVVIRNQGNLAILPVDREAVPIFQARVSLKWDISTILSAVVWAQYVRDNNGTFVERDPNEGTVALRTFISPDFFGFGSSVQARF